jgi:hypothetical protein
MSKEGDLGKLDEPVAMIGIPFAETKSFLLYLYDFGETLAVSHVDKAAPEEPIPATVTSDMSTLDLDIKTRATSASSFHLSLSPKVYKTQMGNG